MLVYARDYRQILFHSKVILAWLSFKNGFIYDLGNRRILNAQKIIFRVIFIFYYYYFTQKSYICSIMSVFINTASTLQIRN